MTPFFVKEILSALGALHDTILCETRYGTFTARLIRPAGFRAKKNTDLVKHDTFSGNTPSFQQKVNAKKVTPIMKIA
jgi:hypothetical protein